MEDFDISKFAEYREYNRIEAKKAEGGLPNSVWETYSSMANTYGGVILLGVLEKEDGSFYTTGLKDTTKLRKQFWDQANNSMKVSVRLIEEKDIEEYKLGNDKILVVRIPRADREQRPIYIDNDMFKGTYRRNGEGDYHCTPSEVRAMLRDQTENTMDMDVLSDFSMSDLNDETINGYRNYFSARKPGHVWENLKRDDFLEKIGAAAISKEDGKLHPTAAGLVMFGEEYRIVRQYPDYFLDYREKMDPTIRWTDRVQSSSGDWTGNIFDFFFRVYSRLTQDIKKPFATEGVFRIDDTPVHKAIREAFANCLVNYDFYLPRSLVITKDPKHIIFENPGSIRTGREQMLKGGISDPRNKALIKMFNMLDIGERAGSGVPDIFSVWAAQGWRAPIVEEQFNPDRTILTLSFESRRQKSAAKISGKNQRQKSAAKISGKNQRQVKEAVSIQRRNAIVDYLEQNPGSKTTQIADAIGLKEPRTRQHLSELINEGRIVAEGQSRARVYRLK